MLLRTAALLAALAALVGAPGTAAAASRPDALAFTKATLAFDLSRGKAIGRAERLGDARRTAALACADTLRAAPAAARDDLFAFYVTWVGAGYFAEDEPTFARWVRALKAVHTTTRGLRQARVALGGSLTQVRRVYGLGERFCDVVDAWAAGSWTAGRRPERIRRLTDLLRKSSSTVEGRLAGARVVARFGGEGRELARDVLQEGIDEPDEVVIQRDDPVIALLTPAR